MAKEVDLESLLRDLKDANRKILNIINPSEDLHTPNWLVINSTYLSPVIVNKTLPFDNPNGEFCYFKKIRDALEYAIANGYVPGEMVSFDTPDYLKNLIK